MTTEIVRVDGTRRITLRRFVKPGERYEIREGSHRIVLIPAAKGGRIIDHACRMNLSGHAATSSFYSSVQHPNGAIELRELALIELMQADEAALAAVDAHRVRGSE